MLHPGESLDGYRVIRLIGSGGFGAVWLCQSEAMGDFRALKFIPAVDQERLKKEFDALCRYRTAAGQLRWPAIMPSSLFSKNSIARRPEFNRLASLSVRDCLPATV